MIALLLVGWFTFLALLLVWLDRYGWPEMEDGE